MEENLERYYRHRNYGMEYYYRDFYDPNHWSIQAVNGSRCSCYAKFLYPKELVRQHYPNADKTLRFNDLLVLRQGVKLVCGKEKQFVWVAHTLESGEVIELHAHLKWIVFVNEDDQNNND